MKKIIASVGLLFSAMAFSQSYVGFLNDNYSGVHAVINNPANIVDSPYRTDINLFGLSFYAGNDYASGNIFDLIKNTDDFDFEKDITKNPLSKNNVITNIDVLGPSFMFNIMPKHSIAISTRVRSMANLSDINGAEADKLRKNKFDVANEFNTQIGSPNVNTNVWGELGLTYAAVIMDKNIHFLKGGLTLKYLQGVASARFKGDNIDASYDPNGQLFNGTNVPSYTTSGTMSYGHSAGLEKLGDINNSNFDNQDIIDNLDKARGFGADLGFTYEWRPEVDKYKYSNKEGQKMYYRDANKYKLKLGLSLTDIGSINYKGGSQNKYDITRNSSQVVDAIIQAHSGGITEQEIKDLKEDLESSTSSTAEELLGEVFTEVPGSSKKSIKTNLPTALHFSADWNINNLFYLNLDTNFNVANSEKATTIENTYSLTPRFESKWFSAYVPMSMRQYSGFNAGFGLRAGPLYIGSGSVLTNLFGKSKGADVYLGLKIPVYQSRPKDADGDGVYNKEDKCPKVPGAKENNGCPWGDKDEDSVKDNVDKCPEVAGPEENNGCPWGDKDNDGVTDNIDTCPEVAGLKELNGCPDADGDGVPDNADKCPKVKGDKDFAGCPKDSDGDGIVDAEDKCPTVAGVKAENGCPEKVVIITEEAKKTINSYAKSIYFNSGKTTFLPGVTEKLDMIVGVMGEYADAKFTIGGHTDSQGAKTTNQRLSEKRAKAVLDYLVSKGVDASRLDSYGFGEDYPIDSNKTRAGRAANRRVEIKLRK